MSIIDVFRGWWSFLKLGVATALSLVIEWGSFEVNAAIASRLGEAPLAAHAIMCNCTSVWYAFPLGVASASTALVGSIFLSFSFSFSFIFCFCWVGNDFNKTCLELESQKGQRLYLKLDSLLHLFTELLMEH